MTMAAGAWRKTARNTRVLAAIDAEWVKFIAGHQRDENADGTVKKRSRTKI